MNSCRCRTHAHRISLLFVELTTILRPSFFNHFVADVPFCCSYFRRPAGIVHGPAPWRTRRTPRCPTWTTTAAPTTRTASWPTNEFTPASGSSGFIISFFVCISCFSSPLSKPSAAAAQSGSPTPKCSSCLSVWSGRDPSGRFFSRSDRSTAKVRRLNPNKTS